jgi:gliding motility-associated-like protein
MQGEESTFNYAWSPNISNTNTASNLTAGEYEVTITSLNNTNCQIIEVITIGNVDGPEVTDIVVTAATCDNNDGTAELSPANLSYSWSDNQSGANRTDLLSGMYTVTATDINGCFDVVEVVIPNTNNLVATANILIEPSCNNADGSVEIVVAGGSGNYEYSTGDAIINNLSSGTYTVDVLDITTGCTAQTIFVLTDDVAGATVIANDVNVSCYGDANGLSDYSLTLDPGFESPETIQILDTDGQVVNDGTLPAGIYFVVVLDANGCLAGQDEFEVIEPETITTEVSVVNQSCNNLGSIEVSVAGGNAPYTFDWSGVDPTAVAYGTYELIITDANDCSITLNGISVDIECDECTNQPEIASVILTESDCDNSNGSIVIDLAGSVNNYIYEWTPAVSTTNTADNLEAGTYTVDIRDISNPACWISETFVINNVAGPVVEIQSTSPATCTANNGTASLSPTNLDYVWSDGGSGAIRNDLSAGIYYVTATDANNCIAIETIEIGEFSSLEATLITNVLPTCGENNGQVTINVSNGSGNYSFAPFGPVISNLASGSYSVTVTDDQTGCSSIVVFSLIDNITAGASISIEDASLGCSGDDNGTVNYTVSLEPGFVEPATEIIFDDQGAPVINGSLSAGSYCIQIRDANDCLATTSCFEVTAPTALNVSIATSAVICDTLGTVSLEVTGGTAPYSFDWNGFDTTSLVTGFYAVTITDANNCTLVIDSIEVAEDICIEGPCADFIESEEELITIQDCTGEGFFCVDFPLEEYLNYTITDNGLPYNGSIGGCEFDSTLSYSVFAIPNQGTFGPYELNSWTVNGQNFSTAFNSIEELVDSMNFWDTSGSWIFDNVAFLLVGGNTSNIYGNLSITQIPTGAVTSLEVNTNLEPNGTRIGINEGQHEVIFVNNATSCADTVDVLVVCITSDIFVDTIPVSLNGELDTFCMDISELPGDVISIENVCEDASGEFVIFETIEDLWCVSYWGAEVGTDTACIVICDNLGLCDTSYLYVTVVDTLNILEPPIAVEDLDTTLLNRPILIDVSFNDTLNGLLDSIYIVSDPNNGVIVNNEDGAFIYIPADDYCNPASPDSFEYAICNAVGCDTATVFITVLCEDIIIFSGLSPNGDGVNDFFTIDGIGEFPNNELSIFNRWGNEVYNKQGYLNDWDGTWRGKLLPDGTYFYVLSLGDGREYSGYVQIHR